MAGATVSKAKLWVVSGLAAVAVGGGALLTAGVASADPVAGMASAASADAAGFGPLGKAGLLASFSCEDIQKVEAWVQNRITTFAADANTKGSTAWLQAQLAAAQAAGDSTAAAKWQKVVDARAAHPDRWQNALTRVQKVEAYRSCS